jgi:hypothetical protein
VGGWLVTENALINESTVLRNNTHAADLWHLALFLADLTKYKNARDDGGRNGEGLLHFCPVVSY